MSVILRPSFVLGVLLCSPEVTSQLPRGDGQLAIFRCQRSLVLATVSSLPPSPPSLSKRTSRGDGDRLRPWRLSLPSLSQVHTGCSFAPPGWPNVLEPPCHAERGASN
ncbi:hypothetical protein LZ32DRAFT_142423 [Colletotrichum eremochloae]|nr:hypothetical protein LZ32DRAFT_142423 [Colletotrichum eremochloae]